jgi:poly-gamma-glutamate capsule biosynthesis protein CapA/YwtB (metallophosphatase superfamily)
MVTPRHRRSVSARRYVARRVGLSLASLLIVTAAIVGVMSLTGSFDRSKASASSLTSTTVTKSTTTTVTKVSVAVTMSFVGDMDLGSTPQLPSNAASYLTPVRASLAASVVFGNLEGTLTNGTASKCGSSSTNCYAFRNPPSYAHFYRAAGFNVLNSANNHSHDFSTQGVSDTSRALQAANIAHAGLPGQIGIVHVGAVRIGFVDFAPYSNTNDLLNYSVAARLIKKAKSEANFVVVYMHSGAEGSSATHVTGAEEYYVGEDRGNAERFAHAAINDGASLVVASGPHVLRGIEFYRGHLIDYSLGDFSSYYNFGTSGILGESAILHVTLSSSGTFESARFISVRLNGPGRPFVDSSGASRRLVNSLSHQDFASRAVTISPNGNIVLPSKG